MKRLTPFEENVVRRVAVGDFLVRSAARYPSHKALRFRDRTYTFAALNDAVNRCAHGLIKMGVKKGDRCAILSHNCDQFAILWWGLMKLGAVITPLNFMLKNEEVKYIVNHSEPGLFFVEDKLIPNMLAIKDELKTVRAFGYINLAGEAVPEGWMNIEDLWKADLPATEPEAVVAVTAEEAGAVPEGFAVEVDLTAVPEVDEEEEGGRARDKSKTRRDRRLEFDEQLGRVVARKQHKRRDRTGWDEDWE